MSPLPKTGKVSTIMSFLKKEKPSMSRKQKIAVALETARRHGADIPPKESQVKALKRK